MDVRVVDLRSDTATLPTPEMKRAMANAPLGDDVFREDPTVNRLQEAAAERMGKEAAIFVASGTMGNLIGVLVNARHGEEVIADADAHVFMYEAAGAATVGGIQIRQVTTERGVMSPGQVEAAIRPAGDVHQPRTAAVSIEDTHNRHGGIAWSLEELSQVSRTARRHGLAVHLDGARIFNAAVAIGAETREIAATGDTVTFCLSKGLGCPVGSLLCGPAEKIEEAHRWRKMLGGGMRQAGVLAAAGLVALESMVDRLAEDHAHARTLAEGLAEMEGVDCDLSRVQTNLVFFRLSGMSSREFADACRLRGVLAGTPAPDRVRLVTHHGVGTEDVQHTLQVCQEVLSA